MMMGDSGEIKIPVPWGHIAAKTWGSVEGKPVLGVHGWLDNAGTFDKLIPKLSKSLYVVAIDLPGHGWSSHTPQGIPCHFADLLVSLRRIVNYLKWSKFSLLGHSLGAGLGAVYSSLYPSQVERLVLIDLAKPLTEDNDEYVPEKVATSIDTFLAMEAKLLSSDPPSYSYQDAFQRKLSAFGETLKEESAKALMERGCRKISEDRWVFTRDIRFRSPQIQTMSHEQCYAILNNMKCHNLLIKAKLTSYFEPEEIATKALQIYKEKCASFEFVEVDGDHYVHLNEPEKIADIVNKFLTAAN